MNEPIVLEPAQAAIVRSLTTDACQDMFQTLGSPVVLLEKPGGLAHDIAAFIGFTGSARGMLMISSSTELFRSSYPSHTGTTPSVESKPGVGFKPTILLHPAGMRPDPAVSVPRAKLTSPAATATADPELDPPEMYFGSKTLRQTP